MRAKPAFLPSALLQGDTRRFNFQEKLIYLWSFREELAIIENRILEKELLAKKKAEKRAKNIAVNKITLYLYIWMKIIFIAISGSHTNCFMTSCANLQKHNTILLSFYTSTHSKPERDQRSLSFSSPNLTLDQMLSYHTKSHDCGMAVCGCEGR